jgi:hypothetical protein
MQTDRRAILHLVAVGRISPSEAERLLIAWNEGREAQWALAACVVIALVAQLKPQEWLPGVWASLHPAILLVNHLIGGIL